MLVNPLISPCRLLTVSGSADTKTSLRSSRRSLNRFKNSRVTGCCFHSLNSASEIVLIFISPYSVVKIVDAFAGLLLELGQLWHAL